MLNNYSKKIKRLSHDKGYCQMIWDERIDEALRNHDAYENGKDEGIEQIKHEMIINFYNNGISIDLISKSSGLSIDEVKEIINSSKNIQE